MGCKSDGVTDGENEESKRDVVIRGRTEMSRPAGVRHSSSSTLMTTMMRSWQLLATGRGLVDRRSNWNAAVSDVLQTNTMQQSTLSNQFQYVANTDHTHSQSYLSYVQVLAYRCSRVSCTVYVNILCRHELRWTVLRTE